MIKVFLQFNDAVNPPQVVTDVAVVIQGNIKNVIKECSSRILLPYGTVLLLLTRNPLSFQSRHKTKMSSFYKSSYTYKSNRGRQWKLLIIFRACVSVVLTRRLKGIILSNDKLIAHSAAL
jgi:hypothetical protein